MLLTHLCLQSLADVYPAFLFVSVSRQGCLPALASPLLETGCAAKLFYIPSKTLNTFSVLSLRAI
jgi:hypothetical protein